MSPSHTTAHALPTLTVHVFTLTPYVHLFNVLPAFNSPIVDCLYSDIVTELPHPVVFIFMHRLALYVYEYLLHVGAQKSAQTFLSEVSPKDAVCVCVCPPVSPARVLYVCTPICGLTLIQRIQ